MRSKQFFIGSSSTSSSTDHLKCLAVDSSVVEDLMTVVEDLLGGRGQEERRHEKLFHQALLLGALFCTAQTVNDGLIYL
jgi:hypothetical protein